MNRLMNKQWLMALMLLVLPGMMVAATPGNVMVQAEQNGEVVQAVEDNTTVVKQVDYIGLDSWSKSVTSTIHFSGTEATPDSTVMVTIPDANLAQTSPVDASGQWSVQVPVVDLSAGSYYAYVAAAEGEVMGNSIPVAYFTVESDQALSLATWIFLGTSAITIFALLLAITLQLLYNSKHHSVV